MFLKFKRQDKLPIMLPKYNQKTLDTGGYTFIVRRANTGDIDTLVRIEEAVYDGKAPWLLRDFLSELSRSHIRLYLVIERHNQVIGFIGSAYQRDSSDMHITNIAVVPIWQQNGIGTLMIDEITQFTQSIGIKTVSLEARISNVRAIKLYEKLGFKQTGVKKGYYLGDREDAVSMVKSFDNQTGDN